MTLVAEYAILMAGGSMMVRPNDPDIEKIYPVVDWVKAHQRNGGKVYTRTVHIIDDWVEVPK